MNERERECVCACERARKIVLPRPPPPQSHAAHRPRFLASFSYMSPFSLYKWNRLLTDTKAMTRINDESSGNTMQVCQQQPHDHHPWSCPFHGYLASRHTVPPFCLYNRSLPCSGLSPAVCVCVSLLSPFITATVRCANRSHLLSFHASSQQHQLPSSPAPASYQSTLLVLLPLLPLFPQLLPPPRLSAPTSLLSCFCCASSCRDEQACCTAARFVSITARRDSSPPIANLHPNLSSLSPSCHCLLPAPLLSALPLVTTHRPRSPTASSTPPPSSPFPSPAPALASSPAPGPRQKAPCCLSTSIPAC